MNDCQCSSKRVQALDLMLLVGIIECMRQGETCGCPFYSEPKCLLRDVKSELRVCFFIVCEDGVQRCMMMSPTFGSPGRQ